MRDAVEKNDGLFWLCGIIVYRMRLIGGKKSFHGLSCSENRHSCAGESPVAREVHLCDSIFQSFTKAMMLAVT